MKKKTKTNNNLIYLHCTNSNYIYSHRSTDNNSLESLTENIAYLDAVKSREEGKITHVSK